MKDIRANGGTSVSSGVARAVKMGAKTIILITDGGHNTPSRSFPKDLERAGVDPKLKGTDLFYIRVKGDFDIVWEHLDSVNSGRTEITRLIDLRDVNVNVVYGFLKIILLGKNMLGS